MRILMAAHYWPPHVGGIEFVAREQARRLTARGHEVSVITSRMPGDPALTSADGFPVHRVRASNVLEERMRLPYPLFSPALFTHASELARNADVVVAHTHTFMPTVAVARAARRGHKPFVLVQHNPYIEYPFPLDLVQRTADATLGRYTIGAATRLVAVSEFTAEYLRRLAPAREVSVVYSGVDSERFSPVDRAQRACIRERLGIPGNAFVALTVCRLFYRHGLDTLLEAVAQVRDLSDLHVVIGGRGPERGEIEAGDVREGLTNVRLAGYIADADLADYYRAADVFVLPTRTGEGFGLVIIEAAASGIPTIATDSGAPREIVDDGKTGLLVSPGAPRELATAITRLASAPDRAAAMGAAALEASARFTWDRSIDALERVLTEAVDRGNLMSETVLVDARWLGIGGPGRVAEHLLQGLHALTPAGRWVIWGPPAADAHLWPGATRVPNRFHPKRWYSQREFPGPRREHAAVAYFAHHLRPAWKLAPAEVTTVHDTIPFRYPPVRVLGPGMRAYITWMARHSTIVATDSEFSKQSLIADCRVAPDRIAVLPLPIDHASAERVRARRAGATPEARAIYVGRDAPHKNLDRLVTAFAATEFASAGAVLTLAGVDGAAATRLRDLAARRGARVELPGVVPQADLESLLASSALLVQPSLEEGFGLPVAEAMAAGIPVAISTGGALLEIVRGAPVVSFDPRDVDAIAGAIDRVASAPTAPVLDWPGPEDFAHAVLAAIDQAGSRSRK